ncbi:MAG: iron-sulfur cluster assembly scaffold protein [Pseudomonadota bacterium]
MVNDLYNKAILTLAGNIERAGRLADPDASVFLDSPLCGSRITVDIKMQDDKVSDYAAEVKACALGQAASAIMAKHVIGQTGAQLRQVRDAMRAMLKSHAHPPSGEWRELEVLQPVADYKARHGSVMLPFEAVVKAIDEIAAKRAAAGSAHG